MERSNIPLQEWVIASFLILSHPQGVSSIQLAKHLGTTQKSAWFLGHGIREAFKDWECMFGGPVEVDEVYLGVKEKNKHVCERLKVGGGAGEKTPVVGIRDRKTKAIAAAPIENANKVTVETMINESVQEIASVYADQSCIYGGLENHEVVNPSYGEYVRGDAHTNGIESFWTPLKRGYYGT